MGTKAKEIKLEANILTGQPPLALLDAAAGSNTIN